MERGARGSRHGVRAHLSSGTRRREAIVRLYVKLFLMLGIAAALQVAVRPSGECAYEMHFAARCWRANALGDAEAKEALVEEGRQHLVLQLERERERSREPAERVRVVAAAPGRAAP